MYVEAGHFDVGFRSLFGHLAGRARWAFGLCMATQLVGLGGLLVYVCGSSTWASEFAVWPPP